MLQIRDEDVVLQVPWAIWKNTLQNRDEDIMLQVLQVLPGVIEVRATKP